MKWLIGFLVVIGLATAAKANDAYYVCRPVTHTYREWTRERYEPSGYVSPWRENEDDDPNRLHVPPHRSSRSDSVARLGVGSGFASESGIQFAESREMCGVRWANTGRPRGSAVQVLPSEINRVEKLKMAINDPVVVRFTNEQVRPLSDLLIRTYYASRRLSDYLAANPEILTALSAGKIDDSDSSGRKPVTAEEVKTLLLIADALVKDFEADKNAKRNSVLRVAVNPGA